MIRVIGVFVLSCVFFASDAQQMSGIFRATDARMAYVQDLPWAEFMQQHQQWNGNNHRLINLEVTGVGKDQRYWGIFMESTRRDTVLKVNSWAAFVEAKRTMAAAGYLLATMQGYAISEEDAYFIGSWHLDPDTTSHKIWKLDNADNLREMTENMAKQHYYLQDVEVFTTPAGKTVYLALYHFSFDPIRNYTYICQDPKTFSQDYWQRYQSKVRLIDFEYFHTPESDFYLGVYQPGTYPAQVLRLTEPSEFLAKWEQLKKDNFALVSWDVK